MMILLGPLGDLFRRGLEWKNGAGAKTLLPMPNEEVNSPAKPASLGANSTHSLHQDDLATRVVAAVDRPAATRELVVTDLSRVVDTVVRVACGYHLAGLVNVKRHVVEDRPGPRAVSALDNRHDIVFKAIRDAILQGHQERRVSPVLQADVFPQ